jgi:cytochrome c oxidase subunit 4
VTTVLFFKISIMFRTLKPKYISLKSVRFNQTAVGPFTQIEARWSRLPEAEQGAIADKLAALQKGDWKKMSLEEKRAGKFTTLISAYFIAYGAHGARAHPDPTLNYKVLGWVSAFLAVTFVIWRATQSCTG